MPHRSPSDHVDDQLICTYEVPPSSELQSIDPVLVQQIESSAELTVHLTLSQTESGLATYETVSNCKKECEYDGIDETYRKSKSVSKEFSDIQERARENTVLVSGENGIQQPSTSCNKKEEKEDYVYAVVYKERKGRASSEASILKKSSDPTQKGTSRLPVNRGSCVGSIGRPSHPSDSGLENNTKAVESKTPQPGGGTEYLYAAVDKTEKKRKQPQVIHFTNPDKTFFVVVFLISYYAMLLMLFFVAGFTNYL